MKTFLFTPAFCKWKMLADCLEHIYKTPPRDVEHVIILQHYPVNLEENNQRIRDLAKQYGCTLVDSGSDVGLHNGLNNAMKVVGVTREDYIIGCDPDNRPTPGFIDAFRDVMKADPTIAVLGMNFWVITERFQQGKLTEAKIADRAVWLHPNVEMWDVCAFNSGLIHDIGGFSQPNNYYGGLEIYLMRHWVPRGMKLAYLADFRSDHATVDHNDPRLVDQSYREWKISHATKGFSGSFADFLAVNK